MANPINLATLFREQIGGRRNLIINGAMQVWQRGTSATGVGSGSGTYETADRWKFILDPATTVDSYQQAFTLGQTDVPGEPEFYLESDVTASTGASTYYILAQHIEDVRSLAGQTATLSFWAKSSVGGNKVGIELNQSFGGGSTRVTSVARDSVTLSTSWQKFSVTVDIASISGKTIGTTSASYLELYLWCSAGTDFDFRSSSTPEQTGQFDFALIQLEAGETATPFEHRSYAEELALCYRYYQTYPSSSATTVMFTGIGLNSISVRALAKPFGGLMRAIPAITLPTSTFIKGNGSSLAVTSVQTGFQVGAGYTFVFNAASGVSANHVYYITGNTGSDALELTAEL